MFSIKVDTPKDLKAEKLFVVNGALVNNSNSSWEVEHGADRFTYDVYDMKGELVLQDVKERIVDAIGFVVRIKHDPAKGCMNVLFKCRRSSF